MRHPGSIAAVIAIAAAGTAGCMVPIGIAAPQASHVAPPGESALRLQGDAPATDLSAIPAVAPDPASPHHYPTVANPAFQLQLGIGVVERFELELGTEGAWGGILPVPLGLHLGGRFQLVEGPTADVVVAARGGYLRRSNVDRGGEGGHVSIQAAYAAASVTARFHKVMRPTIALNVQPVYVWPEVETYDADPFQALAVTTSFGIATPELFWGIHLAPFGYVGLLTSTNIRGTGFVSGFGLAFLGGHSLR